MMENIWENLLVRMQLFIFIINFLYVVMRLSGVLK
jgi:hypothetical protein